MRSRSTEPGPEEAFQAALRLLTGRDHSSAAMIGKLQTRGFPMVAAEEAVSRLCSAGLINDHRYAEQFVDSARESGRYAGYRLRMELRRRGVPGEVIDAVMSVDHERTDQGATVRGLIERRFPAVARGDCCERDKRRAVQFLQRRGFSMGEILKAIREPEQL